MSGKSSIVFVGAFSEKDCAEGKGKKAVAKAQKKTGLKYVMSKYMLKRLHSCKSRRKFMFEKKAEEYVRRWIVDEDENALMQEAYKDGAEFGYNKANEDAKEIMNIAIEGIKRWGVVGGKERPFEKQAEMLFCLFLEKAEQFISDVKKKEITE